MTFIDSSLSRRNARRGAACALITGALSAVLTGCGAEASSIDNSAPAPGTNEDIATVSSAIHSGFGNCPDFDDYAACLCEGQNLTGYCQIFSYNTHSGMFAEPPSLAPFHNDALSSMAVGPFVTVVAYEDQFYYFKRICTTFQKCSVFYSYPGTGSSPAVQEYNTLPGFDNMMSSVRIALKTEHENCFNGPPFGKVALYTDADYGGVGDCVVLNKGTYPHPVLGNNFGMFNDWLSSVKVWPGTTARLFQDVGPGGSNVSITQNTPNLGTLNFNDKTSAIVVF
jgi:hypothetical protein